LQYLGFGLPILQVCLDGAHFCGSGFDIGGNLAVIESCQHLPLTYLSTRLGKDRYHRALSQCRDIHLVLHDYRARGDINTLLLDARRGRGVPLHRGGGNDGRGDPEFVNVIPPAQFLSSYVFFTDPTYPETNLVFVRGPQVGGVFADVTLDCAGTLTGWQPIGSSGYEFTRIDLVRHDFDPQGECNNGRHEMTSTAPFGVTVWGWGSAETGGIYGDPSAGGFFSQAVSYAYPAGMSVKPINDVVVPSVPK